MPALARAVHGSRRPLQLSLNTLCNRGRSSPSHVGRLVSSVLDHYKRLAQLLCGRGGPWWPSGAREWNGARQGFACKLRPQQILTTLPGTGQTREHACSAHARKCVGVQRVQVAAALRNLWEQGLERNGGSRGLH